MGKHGKRKAGFIGFQSREIAFIEDEMAAIAAEYGLDVDQVVASNVNKRKDAKKARHRKHQTAAPAPSSTASASSYADGNKHPVSNGRSRVELLRPVSSRSTSKQQNGDDSGKDEHAQVLATLRVILPDGGVLHQCAVPGCNCGNGGREMMLNKTKTQYAVDVDAIQCGQCKKCQHGVLQHAIIVREDEGVNKPSGGQRLLSAFYELIRLARIAGSIYCSRVWTTSAMTLLNALLVYVKKQFTAGGTQNGQKTITELHQEQQLLGELQNQWKKAEQATGKSSRDELPILLACIFDQMYFHCYYASIVLYGRACGAVPAPEVYFKELEGFTPEAFDQLEQFINQELNDKDVPAGLIDSLVLPMGHNKHPSNSIALLDIYHARLREGIRLFYEQGIGMHGEMDAIIVNPNGAGASVSKSKKPQKKHYRREKGKPTSSERSAGNEGLNNNGLVELPCYPLLAQWRNNCRDWCCHLYAYATPTPEALSIMTKYAPLVEIGAGTGYWSSLLQKQNVDIVAYDKCPPSVEDQGTQGGRARKQERNAYHGQVPPFAPIGKGGPEVLKQDDMKKRNLFLCYPPPHDEMAAICIRLFQGEYVIYIGEWQGDTGDRRYEKELETRFVLERELQLPNWDNSAYNLTIWKRRRNAGEISVSIKALSCFKCSKSIQDALDEGDEMRRCVLCKTNVYCSSFCEESDRRAHSAEHAKRLIFLEKEGKLNFENDAHYAPLIAVTELNTEKEDKVVHHKSNWKELMGKTSSTQEANDSEDDDDGNGEDEDEASEDSSDEENALNATQKSASKPKQSHAFAFNFDA